jgi:uncharacterized membrane protein YhaH (DUF805 family)
MHRAIAGGIAVLIGTITGLVSALAAAADGAPHSQGWVLILSIFLLPVFVACLAAGLAALEFIAVTLKAPRIPVLLSGGIALPIGFAVMSSIHGQLASGGPGIFDAAWAMSSNAVGPCFLMCAVYAGLTISHGRKPVAPNAPQSAAPPPPPQQPKPAPQPSVLAPVVLQDPPRGERLLQIVMWPEERIGQRHFMYVIQLWSMAASLWFVAPFAIGAFIGFDQETRLMIAAFGWMALFWCAFCAVANRLHDLGIRGIWAAAPILAALAWVISEGPPDQGWFSMTSLMHWIVASVLCYGLAAAVLITRKGEPWSNQYGPESS